MARKKIVETIPQRTRAEDREEIKLTLELLGTFHDSGLSLMTRTIYMGSESDGHEGETGTDAKMAERFIKNLHVLEFLSDDPVIVIANNCGGDIYHGLAIYDAIKQSSCDVTIKVRGYAMSMGSIILQSADTRIMSRTSTQLIHDGEMGIQAHSRTFIKWGEETKRINNWCAEMYLTRIREKHPSFSMKKLLDMLDHDTFLTAEQSIELGLADEIG